MASSPEGRALVATGSSAAAAYGGTSVAVAGAAPIAVTVGVGAVIGGAIGLPVGIYTAGHSANPFVNGSLNPFGRSAADVAKDSWNPQKPDKDCDDEEGLRVGRWMHPKEYSAMLLTNTLQEGDGASTNVLYPSVQSNYLAAPKGHVYIEFDLPGDSIRTGKLVSTNPGQGWYKWYGPNFIKPGPPFPYVKNVSGILETK